MKPFSELQVWRDAKPRSAAENMAVDQVLLEQGVRMPLLRFYKWAEPTVSFGYFGSYAEALNYFGSMDKIEQDSDIVYMRRWTGGGMVDHRKDETYTLLLPKGHEVEQLRGAGSYRAIHEALASALQDTGEATRLSDGSEESGEAVCFVNPVAYDVLGKMGRKLAGAGQRRSKFGLLHQGSVVEVNTKNVFDSSGSSESWHSCFVQRLSDTNYDVLLEFDEAVVENLVQTRYATEAWLRKR